MKIYQIFKEAFRHDVDHMPGAIRRDLIPKGCTKCNGHGHLYKTPDGKIHTSNQRDAKRIKCPLCKGIGEGSMGGINRSNPRIENPDVSYEHVLDPVTKKGQKVRALEPGRKKKTDDFAKDINDLEVEKTFEERLHQYVTGKH